MRTLFSLIVVALLLAMPAAVFADPIAVEMIVDGGATETDVGDVKVWDDGTNLYVYYVPIDPLPWPWHSITLTHLEVGTGLSDIPQKNGNPIPGKFTWSEAKGNNADLDGDGTPDLGYYEIPLGSLGAGTKLYIAAHAEVCSEDYETYPDVDSIISALPATVTMDASVTLPASYVDVTISDGGILDGSYIGYCIDSGILIDVTAPPPPPYYDVAVDTNGLVDFDGDPVMDRINYILNQIDDYLSQGYSHSDIQVAIWRLLPLQSLPTNYPKPDAIEANVTAILNDANANGVDYEPECGDYLGIKLEPPPIVIIDENGNEIRIPVQRILIRIPLECGCDTAWGSIKEFGPLWDYSEPNPHDGRVDDTYGYDFPGKNWAHYFTYVVQGGNGAPPRMSLASSVTTTWGSIKNR